MKVRRHWKIKNPVKRKRLIKFKGPIKIKRKVSVKRPNGALYFVAYALVYPLLKICFKLDVERKELDMPEGAYVMVANHHTMIDFLLAMLAFYPRRLNAVGAQKWFLYKPLNKFLPMMGVIPKNMFDPDVRSIIGMKTVLNRGDGILLFPEGRCSSSQAYAGMHKSTGKLIKKFGVPVLSCYIEGAEVCLPHWRKGFRFGRIRVTYKNLFSESDVKTLSIDEINAAVDARLSGAEGALPIIKPFRTTWSRKLAKGLHHVLYYCPKCNMEFTMATKGNSIFCTACGNKAVMDRYAKLTPTSGSVAEKEISLWFRDQVRREMESISEDMEPIFAPVDVRTPSPKSGEGMEHSGFGAIRFDPKGLGYIGFFLHELVNLSFPTEAVPAMSYDHNDNLQLYFGGKYYMFIPDDPRKCLKYVIMAECIHWKFSSRVLLTPGVNSGYVPQRDP